MKRSLFIVLTAMLIIATAVSVALAASGPTADAYVRSTSTGTNYGTDVYLSLYTNGSGCTSQDYSYLKFDLSSVTQTIGRATLTLTTGASPSSVIAGTKVSLYPVADDGWIESGVGSITYANAPVVGTELLAVDAPTINNQAVVFGSNLVSTALSTYLQTEAQGDKVASFAVKLTGACNATTTGVRFASKENVTVGNRPSLALFTPTAVTMSTFRSPDPAVNWPLIIGLGALAAVVTGGLAVTRRRAAGR